MRGFRVLVIWGCESSIKRRWQERNWNEDRRGPSYTRAHPTAPRSELQDPLGIMNYSRDLIDQCVIFFLLFCLVLISLLKNNPVRHVPVPRCWQIFLARIINFAFLRPDQEDIQQNILQFSALLTGGMCNRCPASYLLHLLIFNSPASSLQPQTTIVFIIS